MAKRTRTKSSVSLRTVVKTTVEIAVYVGLPMVGLLGIASTVFGF